MTLFGYLCQECDKTYEPVDSEAPCTTFVEDYCLFLALILNGAIAYHKCDDLLTYTWQRARTVWSVAVRNVLIRCLSLSLSHMVFVCIQHVLKAQALHLFQWPMIGDNEDVASLTTVDHPDHVLASMPSFAPGPENYRTG